MNIGVIGVQGVGPGALTPGESVSYFSDRTLLDFEIVIWNLGLLPAEAKQPMDERVVGSSLRRRNSELEEFFGLGGLLVVLIPRTGSVVGKSPSATLGHSLSSFVPGLPNIVPLSGTRIVARFGGTDGPALRELWETNSEAFAYEGILSESVGRPFLFTAGSSERIVGSLVPRDAGHLLLLPAFLGYAGMYWERFCRSLVSLSQALQPEDQPPPEWLHQYSSPHEREITGRISVLEAQLSDAQAKLTRERAALESELGLKLLLSASGRTLERKVMEALRELGIEAEPGPEAQDDVLLKWGNKAGIAEVKGVTRSAAEKHAAQLEKWCSNWRLAEKGEVKGFLIVNGYRDRSLRERPSPIFPSNVVTFSAKRDHCLVTTSQLLALVLEGRREPARKADLTRSLWSTVGLFQGFDDLEARLSRSS